MSSSHWNGVWPSPTRNARTGCGRLEGVTPARLPRWQRDETVDPARRFGQHRVTVPTAVSARLREVAREIGVPVKSVLLAAHFKVLSAWTGQRQIVTGLISNGRPETADGERTLGLFLNTVPLRLAMDGGDWQDLVRRVNALELDVMPHRRFPLAEVQRAVGVQDLIETSFNFIHFHVYQGLTSLGPIEVLDATAFERTNFAMMATFSLDPMAAQPEVGLTLHYDAGELSAEQVQVLGDSYRLALECIAAKVDGSLDTVSLLPARERQRVLVDFNQTAAPRHGDACLHDFFEAQAARTPDAVALVCGEDSLTYRELECRANQLARYLRSQGVRPEVLVGVCLERSADLVISLLAILKAGGAYVPLDAAYPHQRLAFILADSQARMVITSSNLADRIGQWNGQVLCLDRAGDALRTDHADDRSDRRACPSNLAYIIYTSGSTGQPKGVAIEHRSAVALMHWARATYSDEELGGVLAATSVCFDLSIFELFAPLSWGGRVVLVDNALALADLAPEARVRLVNTVPSAMGELIRLGGLPGSVRTVNLAGEPLSTTLVDAIYSQGNVERVMDLYGPSEDTTYSTATLRRAGEPATIGKPIRNTRAYILGEDLQPVPVGAIGELHVAGAGLARGYLHKADMTAERFLPDPFSREAGARMYRTGDLGRFRPDGNIEFLGRVDHQVKIRGFRIELGEIEAAMVAHPAVREAVAAVTSQADDMRIVGYYVADDGQPVDERHLREYLAGRLPAYMVPTGFVELPSLPLTPNGKIDRKALPAWKAEASSDDAQTGPRDDLERKIAECWQDLLQVEAIGVDDNFFELGGHSLLATQVVSRLRQTFDMALSLRSLFDAPTVAGLARVIREAMGEAYEREAGEREEIEL